METGVSAGTAQRIGVPRETFPLEKRVATVPDVVEKLIKLGFKVAIESGAGDAANFSDDSYRAVGAEVIEGAAALFDYKNLTGQLAKVFDEASGRT